MIDSSDRVSIGPPLRLGIGLAGVAMFAGGLATMFTTNNGGGSAALLTLGTALTLIAIFGDRMEVLELGSAKFSLRDLAKGRFALAKEREAAGDVEAATEIRYQGKALERLADEYRHLRRTMRGGIRRTGMLEHVMAQLGLLARERQFDRVDVWEWFNRGRPEARITAIGLMHGDPELRDVFAALDAIENSRSEFEQYHGLRLALEMVPTLTDLERQWLRDTIERARGGRRLRRATDRWQMSETILARLSEPRQNPVGP